MLRITFDTNILIELEENRKNKQFILDIISQLKNKNINIAFVAVCAIEKKIKGSYINNIKDFKEWLEDYNLKQIEIIKTIARYDLSFWDYCYYAGGKLSNLEKEIYNIIFGNSKIPYEQTALANKKWRTNIIDTMIFLGHIWNDRDVFITLDNHFLRQSVKSNLENRFKTTITTPKDFNKIST